jgi:CheY-like chemotaxis protein
VVLNNAAELTEERADERLDQIVAAAASGADLVRRLLTFSRQRTEDPKIVEFNDVVREAAGWMIRVMGDEVTIELDLCTESLPVRADPAELQQVLLNLATNARDAMLKGGKLTLKTQESGEMACLSVNDQGRGMDDETQRRAFDPFFTTKAPGQGSGLGLSSAYGVITRLGGSMRLHSAVNEGTSVEIELPRQHQQGAETPSVSPSPDVPARAEGKTILVVEDEPAILRLTERMLKGQGFTVLSASGPAEAAQHLATIAPDLVLSDLSMPGGGGLKVAQTLAETHPGVPIVIMTGYAPEEGNLPGPTLNKPFRRAELLQVVNETLANAAKA